MKMAEHLLVASKKGLFVFEKGQGGLKAVAHHFVGDPVSLVMSDARDGTVCAALNLGHFGVKLHRAKNVMGPFEEIAAPAFPAQSEGQGGEGGDGQKKEGPSVSMIWALCPGGDDQPGRLWAGTIPGGLFMSDDAGDSWTLNQALWNHPARQKWFGGGADEPGIHSICRDPRDSRTLRLGVSCGGVWKTSDDGESWQLTCEGMHAAYMPDERREDPAIQDPHCMVQSPSDPDVLWVQHHNGIFRSTDGGGSWTECFPDSPSNFGFATAVHPTRKDTAFFVPAKSDQCRIPVDGRLVVNRTDDGGASFRAITAGLPSENAWDLIYRHALVIDESGDHLAFGSTTGGLWHSADSGETFSLVSAHLPPIAALCWA
jgi:hypothetical protein